MSGAKCVLADANRQSAYVCHMPLVYNIFRRPSPSQGKAEIIERAKLGYTDNAGNKADLTVAQQNKEARSPEALRPPDPSSKPHYLVTQITHDVCTIARLGVYFAPLASGEMRASPSMDCQHTAVKSAAVSLQN